MATNKLSELQIRKAKPRAKAYKMADGDGMYLEVTPSGGKWWRLKYRIGKKEKRISLGVYPDVSLKMARERREEARRKLADGVDPSAEKRAIKASKNNTDAHSTGNAHNSFEVVAREWLGRFSHTWAKSHLSRIARRLEADVFPWLGARPVSEITPAELLAVVRRVEERGALETAHRVLGNCGQVLRYAVATARAPRDPSADLRGALPPSREKHHAAILDPKEIGNLLRAFDDYQGAFVTKCALRLAPLLFVRPGELRQMEWGELNLDAAEWNIPSEKMKMRHDHLVPLSRQALAILREIQHLTGRGRFVFPSARSDTRPMSENAILAALRRMGYGKDEMTGHGFRAMARTILDEVLGVRPDFIEHQLAHAVKDPNGRAYNRTAHLPARRAMMQQWADYLESLKSGCRVIQLQA